MTGTVILGAGYAGVVAANTLAAYGRAVTVINPVEHFVERVRLHRVAARDRPHARIPLEQLLHPDIRVMTDTAARINAGRKVVTVESGDGVAYDQLIVATGSGRASDAGEWHSVATEETASRLVEALDQHPSSLVRIHGAGLTGVETAAVLATAGRDVALVSRTAWPEDSYHRAQRRRLETLGVRLLIASQDTVRGEEEILVDCTGLHAPLLATASGLPVDGRGRLIVTRTLQVREHPEIIGAGDAASVTGADTDHLRMSCATALPAGAHAAAVVAALEQEQSPPEFEHRYFVRCVDLGGLTGRIQFVTARDRLQPFALTSLLGGLGKEAVIRSTVATMRSARGRKRHLRQRRRRR